MLEGNLTESYSSLRELEKRYGTPFYIFHKEKFVENYDELEKAFKRNYSNFIIGYSYKTNYIPYLCKIVEEKGGYAEVVSGLEYYLASKIYKDNSKIIFNGPIKTFEDIKKALDNKSLLNLDSWYELEYVRKYAEENPEKEIKVGIRININLSNGRGGSDIQAGYKKGRFGFSSDEKTIKKIIEKLKNKNIKINGLHGHTSSSSRSLNVYKTITQTLCEIAEKYFYDTIEYIDIGGGIYGKIPPEMKVRETPTFDDYADTICSTFKNYQFVQNRKPLLILEPGISVTANSLSFVCKVYDVKEFGDTKFAVVDGSIYHVKPSMHRFNLPFIHIKQQEISEKETYNIVGSTCMEKDYLLEEIVSTKIRPGDYLMIKNVGAYTIVLSPPFINVAPPILVKEENDYRLIRNPQSYEEFFRLYNLD